MPQQLSIRDALVRERDEESVPDSELTRTSMIRRRLLRGEVLDQYHFDDAKGRALFTVTLAAMKKMGFEFEIEKAQHPNGHNVFYRYLLLNPEHEPSQEQYDAAKGPSKARTQVRSSSAKTVYSYQRECSCGAVMSSADSLRKHLKRFPDHEAVDGEHDDHESTIVATPVPTTPVDMPLPMVTSTLTVFLVMEQDGEFQIGLRNGKQSWIATLNAAT